jgi:MoaA/NifB/PqqE/SkfB family radical SAM enzyme
MYCPAELHDSTSSYNNLDTLMQIWNNFYSQTKHHKKSYTISFTGGEVTANKHFLVLCSYIKETSEFPVKILFSTNGSAGEEYYRRASELVDSITFSIHSEFIDEQKFFAKAKLINNLLLRPKKSFHVSIMNEWWNQDRIKLYIDFLTAHNISYSLNEIDYSFKTRDKPIMQGVLNLE